MKNFTQKNRVKVPVVMQLEDLECGAACLTMVMAYYKKWVPLEQVRAACGVSRDGSRALNVIKAARTYGMQASGFRYEGDTIFEKATLPCIIHWDFNHFVVLCGRKGDQIYLNDPARGTYIATAKEFDESFTGICLQLQPGEGFVPNGRPKSTLGFAQKRMKGAGDAIAFAAATAAITTILSLVQPVFARVFFDRILIGDNPQWFYPFMGLLAAVGILTLAVQWAQTVYNLKLSGKLAIVADFNFFWHVLRLPMEFFSQRLTGDIIMRQSLNAGIVNTMVNTFAPLLLKTGMMVFYLVIMLRYNVLLSAIGLSAVVVDILISHIISEKRINAVRVQMRDSSKLASETMAGIEMIETIKASGAENGFFTRWAGYQASTSNQSVQFEQTSSYLGLIPSIASMLASTLILVIGIYLTVQGEFTVGMITAFTGFLVSFRAPMQSLIGAGRTIQEMRTNMERIEDVLEYPVDVHEENPLSEGVDYTKLSGQLSIRGLTFGYAPFEPPLIEGFDLELEKGKSVALVGGSACGKSTIAKLVSGLYPKWSGEILFDGKPIEQINHSIMTSSLAVVDQDITLFEDTIGENIKMWDTSIEGFEAIMAARDAGVHDEIMQRDGGYASKIKEGGKDLSGGQRQRLEIARALAQDPTLVILDEATSALDSKTEAAVIHAIRERGITCIVIAHRLSVVRHCDEILVLKKGKVIERGTHEELYCKGGEYTTLVSNE